MIAPRATPNTDPTRHRPAQRLRACRSAVVIVFSLACAAAFGVAAAEGRSNAAPESRAGRADPAAVEDVEEVEEVEEVVAVTGAATTAASSRWDAALQLVGRLHPLAVHFPIAWLVLLLLGEALALRRRAGEAAAWPCSGLALLVLSVLSAVPAVVTGLIRAATLGAGADVAAVTSHRNVALAAVTAAGVALVLRGWYRRAPLKGVKGAYLVSLGAAVILVGVAGHLGGELVFGRDYLPF